MILDAARHTTRIKGRWPTPAEVAQWLHDSRQQNGSQQVLKLSLSVRTACPSNSMAGVTLPCGSWRMASQVPFSSRLVHTALAIINSQLGGRCGYLWLHVRRGDRLHELPSACRTTSAVARVASRCRAACEPSPPSFVFVGTDERDERWLLALREGLGQFFAKVVLEQDVPELAATDNYQTYAMLLSMRDSTSEDARCDFNPKHNNRRSGELYSSAFCVHGITAIAGANAGGGIGEKLARNCSIETLQRSG